MISFFLLAPVLFGPDLGQDLQVRVVADPTRVEVIARVPDAFLDQLADGKLSHGERWLRFALLDAATGSEGPSLFGSYERRGTDLVFTPRYALTHGQRYRASTMWAKDRFAVAHYQTPARAETPRTVVEHIYPSADTLPANHLKFYIHFSRPMREGEVVFDHIRLLDGAGQAVVSPWRRTELWSADGRRLTLWIHPGRVKEGVSLREEFGAVLEPEQQYTLVVGADLRDADGQPLREAFTKKFCAGQPERTRPAVADWKVTAPRVQTTQPIILEFPRPLDRALLDRFLTVMDAEGEIVSGRIEVGRQERFWSFHPDRSWEARDYRVRVDERLEDLAGNTPLRLFDTDLREPALGAARLMVTFRPQ